MSYAIETDYISNLATDRKNCNVDFFNIIP